MQYNKAQVTYDFTTHKTTALLSVMHRFITTKCFVKTYELLHTIASTYTLTLQGLSNYNGSYKYTYVNTKINKK